MLAFASACPTSTAEVFRIFKAFLLCSWGLDLHILPLLQLCITLHDSWLHLLQICYMLIRLLQNACLIQPAHSTRLLAPLPPSGPSPYASMSASPRLAAPLPQAASAECDNQGYLLWPAYSTMRCLPRSTGILSFSRFFSFAAGAF